VCTMQLLSILFVFTQLLRSSRATPGMNDSAVKRVDEQLDRRSGVRPDGQPAKYAYATLVSGDKWFLPARTLALSMDKAGCRWPRVMLTTFSPAERSKRLLETEHWDVREVARIPNPYDDRGEMTRNTFSMLWAYNLTEFSKIIYIDVDFLVLSNLDALFECGDYCFARSGRETQGRFNGGLQVLTPNQELFNEMVLKGRTNGFGSYNRGVQGFLNEAIPFWCSHGKRETWSQVSIPWLEESQKQAGYRDCRQLSERYNRLSVLTKDISDAGLRPWWLPSQKVHDLYDTDTAALHFNHPSFWAVKPWLWIWYPVYPTAWIWWQVRREVVGETWAAVYWAFVGIAIPMACSCGVVKWGLTRALSAPPLGATAAKTSSTRNNVGDLHGSTVLGRAVRCMRRFAVQTIAFSASASVLVAAALPFDADPIVAWGCYFTLKGSLLGAFALWIFAAEASAVPLAWDRLGCVVRGYACIAIEAVGIWVLPSAVSLNWVSDKFLSPFCMSGQQSCNNVLWTFLAADAVLILSLQLLLLRPLWTKDHVFHCSCFHSCGAATSAASIELGEVGKQC